MMLVTIAAARVLLGVLRLRLGMRLFRTLRLRLRTRLLHLLRTWFRTRLLNLLRTRFRAWLLYLLRTRFRAWLLHLLRTRFRTWLLHLLRTRLLFLLRLRTIFLTWLLLRLLRRLRPGLLRLCTHFRRALRLRFLLALSRLLLLLRASLFLRGTVLLRLLGHRRMRLRPCRLVSSFCARLLPRLHRRAVLLRESVRIGAVRLRRTGHAIGRMSCLGGLLTHVGHLRRHAWPRLRFAATLRLTVDRCLARPVTGLLHAIRRTRHTWRTRCRTRCPSGHM